MSYPTPRWSFSELRQGFHPLWAHKPKFTEKDYPSFDGKVVIVTGGSAGIGYETAKSLAGSTNAKVYIFARNEEKTLTAIRKIELEVAKEYKKPAVDVHFVKVDFNDLTTIKPAAEKFLSLEKRLDLVIHNAGIFNDKSKKTTVQGYEQHLGINAIGPHLLQKFLDPLLIETSKTNKPNETRVVWVASTIHLFSPKGGLNWDDLEGKNEGLGNRIYGQSKAVNAIQALQWPKAHPEATEVVSVSLCPGYLKSSIMKDQTFSQKIVISMLDGQRYGAYTELFAAFSPELTTKNNGAHVISYGNIAPLRRDIANDVVNQKKVWDWLDEQVQPYL